jgi:hypothetical protein
MTISGKLTLSLAGAAVIGLCGYAAAQMNSANHPLHTNPGTSSVAPGPHSRATQPLLPGQDAFGTIQEIVCILERDPTTDWSKVNIASLREHLIDMNEVTLRAHAEELLLPNGVGISVTGEGRTREAIQRMVSAHAHELDGLNGWQARAESLGNGVKLIVTTDDQVQVRKIQGLGFMGLMVQGSHHQAHHLMMARGTFQQ